MGRLDRQQGIAYAAVGIALLLAIADVWLISRHDMWRDEIQAFLLALGSGTPLQLFERLHYEGHPGLWHLLLWFLTRLTSDPGWMQVLHAAIALGAWALVLFASPFSWLEKLLIIASYPLFAEYFLISRNYGIGALLGFAAVALGSGSRDRPIFTWLALGLLANTSVFGTIWSVGLALGTLLARTDRNARDGIGIALYVALVGLAAATMKPPPDMAFSGTYFGIDAAGIRPGIALPDAGLVPFNARLPDWNDWLGSLGHSVVGTIRHAYAQTIAVPAAAGALGLLVLGLIVQWPVILAAASLGSRRAAIEFLTTVAGAAAFVMLWHYPGAYRHQAFVFLALVATMWRVRAETHQRPRLHAIWLAILVVNAVIGLATLKPDPRSFSSGRAAAEWIAANEPSDRLIIGWRDATTETIAGYLGRPLYYIECECTGTFVVWSTARRDVKDGEDLFNRLNRAIPKDAGSEAVFVASPAVPEIESAAQYGLALDVVAHFDGAIVIDENYTIYRARRMGAMAPAGP